jgi:hypothetical protein
MVISLHEVFEVHHPGDYANLNSYQLRDGTALAKTKGNRWP